ncbi:ABC transporter family substrate-binding protein [Luteipulveratus mongoliensis]|uniref:ABC transporter substrate-binding protein n=1 Tax=Luteipulveratus mongoliensis TaxID=571913 RepID=A0A0K1JFB3_9MICO|nr:ABC transporter family substrate-binding protein [Luteipulveratus mongoliensis]AKU15268.1 ABC transporter substrate-binding protein [Luteipulveratus mongoliensis]
MTRPKITYAVALSAALAVALTSCSSDSDAGGKSSTGAAAASPKAASAATDYNPQPYANLKDGGSYTTGGSFNGDDTQGNRWNVNASLTGSRIWAWYNPVAITFSPAGEVQINKDYFTSATTKNVGTKQQLTITINPKAVYNDGTPIDWRSIQATWQVNSGKNKDLQIGGTQGFDQIESVVRGASAKQAVVTFKQPYAAWPGLFTSFINPKAATVANFNNAYSNKLQPSWGAGPFTVQSYDPNSKKIVFVRNPKWWGRKGKLDKRIYLDFAKSSAGINAFKNGQIDYTSLSTPEDINQVKGRSGTQLRKGGSPFEYYLFLNGKSPVLSDIVVRKALLGSVNRAEIAKIEFNGLDYSEPLPGSSVYYSFQKGYEDNVSKVLTFDPAQAGKDLDAAGWKPGKDGIREKGGKQLVVEYAVFDPEPIDKAVAGSLTAALKKVGIKVNLKVLPGEQWASTINQNKFDLVLSGNRSLDPYGVTGLGTFYGSSNDSNITRIGNAGIDKEIAAVSKISDPVAQQKQANAVEQKALKLYGVLPLFSGPSTYSVKKGLANVGASIFLSPLPETVGWQR